MLSSGLLPSVDIEAAVFRRMSLGGGERLSFGVVAVAALENHPNGVVFCLPDPVFTATGCGEGARASDFRRAAGPPQGTEGNEAEKLPNREGRDCGLGGGGGALSSLASKLAAIDRTDGFDVSAIGDD